MEQLFSGVETHIERHLVVAAAPGMQLLSGVSQTVDQIRLHKAVNILIFIRYNKTSGFHIRKDFL